MVGPLNLAAGSLLQASPAGILQASLSGFLQASCRRFLDAIGLIWPQAT